MIFFILDIDLAILRKDIKIKLTTLVLLMTALTKCFLSFKGQSSGSLFPLFNSLFAYSCFILPLEEICRYYNSNFKNLIY